MPAQNEILENIQKNTAAMKENFEGKLEAIEGRLDVLDQDKFNKMQADYGELLLQNQKATAEMGEMKAQLNRIGQSVMGNSEDVPDAATEAFHRCIKNGASGLEEYKNYCNEHFKPSILAASDNIATFLPPEIIQGVRRKTVLLSPFAAASSRVTLNALSASWKTMSKGRAWFEGDAKPSENKERHKITITAHKAMADAEVVRSEIGMIPQLRELVEAEIGQQYGELESDAFINGNGVGRPKGILKSSFTEATDTNYKKPDKENIRFVKSGASGAIAPANSFTPIDKMLHHLHVKYQGNAQFMGSLAAILAMRAQSETTGKGLWVDPNNTTLSPLLYGKKVMIDPWFPAVANGNYPLLFGDIAAAYTRVYHPYVAMTPIIKENDVTLLEMVTYLGGNVTDPDAVIALKVGA